MYRIRYMVMIEYVDNISFLIFVFVCNVRSLASPRSVEMVYSIGIPLAFICAPVFLSIHRANEFFPRSQSSGERVRLLGIVFVDVCHFIAPSIDSLYHVVVPKYWISGVEKSSRSIGNTVEYLSIVPNPCLSLLYLSP